MVVKQEASYEQLEKKLKEINKTKDKNTQYEQLKEIIQSCASKHQWNFVMEAIELVGDEKERNLLIADLIEDTLLASKEIDQAKKFAKYLMPQSEIQPLVLVRIALAENNKEQALKITENLSSPLARNYAYWHIIEFYMSKHEKEKAYEISNKMLENTKTIYDPKTRSFILREIAIELFLGNQDKQKAKEIAQLIPDEKIRDQLLSKINSARI